MTRALYFVLPLTLMSQTPHHDPLYKRLQRLYSSQCKTLPTSNPSKTPCRF